MCSGCGKPGPGYDRLAVREFDFVPLWAVAVTLLYALRRIDCPRCGVKVEQVPWCDPASKSPMTTAFKVFLSRWAKLLSWRQTAVSFGVSWDSVYRAVADVVAYGLEHRDLSGIEAIGVDEVAYAKGHKYLTLVYQLDGGCRRLLHVSRGRSLRSLLGFFRMLKKAKIDYAKTIKFVCSDMWQAYLTVIARKLPEALHILDLVPHRGEPGQGAGPGAGRGTQKADQAGMGRAQAFTLAAIAAEETVERQAAV